ncbi:hypothetical protein [Atlantibacter sp.]|uniref:hypothetical protein n=1 Tax=Atlantibacter sp. TaxID=1903473 RepID=UPI0028AEC1B7|nr:hypothetical protein [Atlantibacter sp.]
MKAFYIALLWVVSFAVYAVILIMMYMLLPQGLLLELYQYIFGSVSGMEWEGIISNVMILGSAFITFFIVWITAFWFIRGQQKKS